MDAHVPYQVDLTTCDKEPIHIPGRIQPHGMLIVLSDPDLTIVQISTNSDEYAHRPARELLGQPLSALLLQTHVDELRYLLANEDVHDNPIYVWTLPLLDGGPLFDGVVHERQGVIVLELEVVRPPAAAPKDFYRLVKTMIGRIQRAPTFEDFCQTTANEVRALTGFDRVMVYQFDEDGHGSVIAEAKSNALDPFLGLHYPASDIPRQARVLYTLNWLRLIPDISYFAVDIVPTLRPDTGAPIDLSYAHLRSVSPIHVEYLQNMGVGASMSISLVKDGELWGLIACHHNAPRHIPYEVRTACEFLAQAVSLQLSAKQTSVEYEYRLRLNSVGADLIERLALADSWHEALRHGEPSIMDLIDAGGVAICTEGNCTLFGSTPTVEDIQQLTEWLVRQPEQEIIVTDSLARDYPPLAHCNSTASGIMALPITPELGEYIIWFRPEVLQAVNWAGEPTKAVEVTEGGMRLSPRKSFESWKETVRLRSLPWKPVEREAALNLRNAVVAMILRRANELEQLNRELSRSNEELDEFAYIASHDLKEPLRGIHNYAHFLLEDYVDKLDDAGQEQLQTIVRLTRRMDTLLNLLLHYSRVGRADLGIQRVSLDDVLRGSVEMLRVSIQETQTEIRVPRPLPVVLCDQVRVGEVFANLIANAIKYNNKAEKWIEIGYLDEPAPSDRISSVAEAGKRYVTCYVRDNGIGIAPNHYETIFRMFKRLHGRDKFGGGTGVGLALVKRIIERHGGTVWIDSTPGEGTTFYFTLPE